MFKTIFETASTISTTDALISLGVAVILGVFLSLVYVFGDTKKKYSYNFAFALVILPVCVCAVIMLIGSDVARAISLGGVFALVRFRSVPGNSKDIVNVFFAMAIGLACGMGMRVVCIRILYRCRNHLFRIQPSWICTSENTAKAVKNNHSGESELSGGI